VLVVILLGTLVYASALLLIVVVVGVYMSVPELQNEDLPLVRPPYIFVHYDFNQGLKLLPGALGMHYLSIVVGCVVQFRVSHDRFGDWRARYDRSSQKTNKLSLFAAANDTAVGDTNGSDRQLLPDEAGQEDDENGVVGSPLPSSGFAAVTLFIILGVIVSLAIGLSFSHMLLIPAIEERSVLSKHLFTQYSKLTKRIPLYYLFTVLPLLCHRLLNSLLYQADVNLLMRKATWILDHSDLHEQGEQASHDDEGISNIGAINVQINKKLRLLQWKVQDLTADWIQAVPGCVVWDLVGIATGMLMVWRFQMKYDTRYPSFLVVPNCVTLFAFLFIQLLPSIQWNNMLSRIRDNPDNSNPLIFVWIERGQLNMKLFGMVISYRFFVSIATTIAISGLSSVWSAAKDDIIKVLMA